MWIAIFVNLACGICMPYQVGGFESAAQCMQWVNERETAQIKGKCELRKYEPKEGKA